MGISSSCFNINSTPTRVHAHVHAQESIHQDTGQIEIHSASSSPPPCPAHAPSDTFNEAPAADAPPDAVLPPDAPPNIPDTLLHKVPRELQQEVHKRGVAVAFLLRLADAPGVIDPSWTIQNVVDKFIRPMTIKHNCSLHDLIPIEFRGLPSVFVSHTWSRKYVGLMEMISSLDLDCFVWLDICCLNQNAYNKENRPSASGLHHDDKDNLQKAIEGTKMTLFCLDDELTSITRIWCMFEVWQAFRAGKGGSKLQAYVTKGAQEALLRDPGKIPLPSNPLT